MATSAEMADLPPPPPLTGANHDGAMRGPPPAAFRVVSAPLSGAFGAPGDEEAVARPVRS
jgi:hypothetical protein